MLQGIRDISQCERPAITLVLLLSALCLSCQPASRNDAGGRVVLKYWEKWTGTEGQAMREIVEAYNASQDRYLVHYMEVGGSQIDRKLVVAIAGGNPPDIAGFWNDRVSDYVQNGALTPIDKRMTDSGIHAEDYLPAVMGCCRYEGYTWGLPLTPATLALFYNRRLFREAGLDPDHPPQTISVLDEYAEKLTRRDDQGKIITLGFSPDIPGWWNHLWGFWFGGDWWDAESQVTVSSSAHQAALEWGQNYFKKYGVRELDRFKAAAENFDSPQWPFFSEHLAMVIQGVWTSNFIRRHAPNLDWGVAPFPSAATGTGTTTFLQCDILVIPKGCPHPDGAWDFVRFTQKPGNLERLNTLHHKFSPLAEVSGKFYQDHPNPHIRLFRDLATTGVVHAAPPIPRFSDFQRWMIHSFNQVCKAGCDPSETLREAQFEIQKGFDRARRQWERVAVARREQWREP
jgi:ABC-type glycerol-3-phosphate transport system substrate-binding protein